MYLPNSYVFLLSITALLIIFSFLQSSNGEETGFNADENFIRSVFNESKEMAVVCDAGSSGTRMFVYTFSRNSKNQLISIETLKNNWQPIVKKVNPGLSSFEDNPDGVIDYFQPLFKYAEENIPEEIVSKVPVFIFATAGMRLIPQVKQDEIIERLRRDLKKVTRMKIIDENIGVIDGAWEGIYSWISLNYMLDKFKPKGGNQSSTSGMIDMGGGSVQITFELPKDDPFMSQHVFDINLGPSDDSDEFKYKLFSTTFLGYGANEGMRKYENALVGASMTPNSTIEDVCSPANKMKFVKSDEDEIEKGAVLQGTGKFDKCVKKVAELIEQHESAECSSVDSTCFLNIVPAPKVNLSMLEIYGFSEYWYTLDNFEASGKYDHQKFAKSAEDYCSKPWGEIQKDFDGLKLPKMEKNRLETNCFKAAWTSVVLHDGFGINKDVHKFESVLQINGEEMQWALGAAIYNLRNYPTSVENGVKNEVNYNLYNHWFLLPFAIVLMVFVKIFWADFNRLSNLRKRTENKSEMWLV